MKAHQERVKVELDGLRSNLSRINDFLADTPSGVALAPEERADMQSQSDVMSQYARILERRIGRF